MRKPCLQKIEVTGLCKNLGYSFKSLCQLYINHKGGQFTLPFFLWKNQYWTPILCKKLVTVTSSRRVQSITVVVPMIVRGNTCSSTRVSHLNPELARFLKWTEPSFNQDTTIYHLWGIYWKVTDGKANSSDHVQAAEVWRLRLWSDYKKLNHKGSPLKD